MMLSLPFVKYRPAEDLFQRHRCSLGGSYLLDNVIKFAKENNLHSGQLQDYEKWGPLSYLIKGFRLLEIGEVVAEQDYLWDNGHWLSVTFRESHSPIKPGDVIAEKTEKINRLFVIRKE